jgi:hypothetical protein
MVPESRLEKTEHGFVPKGEGWFVLNLREAEWRHAEEETTDGGMYASVPPREPSAYRDGWLPE